MAEDNTSSKAGAPVPQEVAPNAFPRLLMKLLQEEAAPDALWWLPCGTAFAMDPKELPSKVLDPYFRRTKFSSFIRRLHNTGFRRTTRLHRKNPVLNLPEGAITLAHDMFQRDAPHLLDSFSCKSAAKDRVPPYFQDAKEKAADRVNSLGAVALPRAALPPAAFASAAALYGAPLAGPAQALFDSARTTRLLQGAETAKSPSSLALLNLREGGLSAGRQQFGLSPGSLLQPPGSFLQRQQLLDQENSMLRQRLLLGSLNSGNNSGVAAWNGEGSNTNQLQQLLQQQQRLQQSHQPVPSQQLHQLQQQEQQYQRLREAAVAERFLEERRRQMVDRYLNSSTEVAGALPLPGLESTDPRLQLPRQGSNPPNNASKY